jgi:hypothetical protein
MCSTCLSIQCGLDSNSIMMCVQENCSQQNISSKFVTFRNSLVRLHNYTFCIQTFNDNLFAHSHCHKSHVCAFVWYIKSLVSGIKRSRVICTWYTVCITRGTHRSGIKRCTKIDRCEASQIISPTNKLSLSSWTNYCLLN